MQKLVIFTVAASLTLAVSLRTAWAQGACPNPALHPPITTSCSIPDQVHDLQDLFVALQAAVTTLQTMVLNLSSGPGPNPIQVVAPTTPPTINLGQCANPAQCGPGFVTTVTNTGSATLVVQSLAIPETPETLGYFYIHDDGQVNGQTLSSNPCDRLSFLRLAPGASCDFVLSFQPNGGAGTLTAGLIVVGSW